MVARWLRIKGRQMNRSNKNASSSRWQRCRLGEVVIVSLQELWICHRVQESLQTVSSGFYSFPASRVNRVHQLHIRATPNLLKNSVFPKNIFSQTGTIFYNLLLFISLFTLRSNILLNPFIQVFNDIHINWITS